MSIFNSKIPTSQPTDKDVILGRGRKYYNHPGNRSLRRTVAAKLSEYSAAQNKAEKSLLLMRVLETIRADGRFLRQDSSTKLWFEASDYLAREKCSQTFRDALSETYKSSKEAKKRRKKKEALQQQQQEHEADQQEHEADQQVPRQLNFLQGAWQGAAFGRPERLQKRAPMAATTTVSAYSLLDMPPTNATAPLELPRVDSAALSSKQPGALNHMLTLMGECDNTVATMPSLQNHAQRGTRSSSIFDDHAFDGIDFDSLPTQMQYGSWSAPV